MLEVPWRAWFTEPGSQLSKRFTGVGQMLGGNVFLGMSPSRVGEQELL